MTSPNLFTSLKELFPEAKILPNHLLAPMTYFKIGGEAEVFIELTAIKQITTLVTFVKEHDIPLTVISGASNVIISDQGIKGVVLKIVNQGFDVLPHGVVRVGAGWPTSLLVRKTIDEGFTGLEKFLGVPGLIGGAVYNNAHYLSSLISSHITRVLVVTPQGKELWHLSQDCDFAYDHSRFHSSGEVILMVEFKLNPGNKEKSEQIIREATIHRAKTQPLGIPSSGCYFRNTPNTQHFKQLFPQFSRNKELPSGFLIEQAGLKGSSIGGIKVSEKHAAFLVNTGKGSSKDVAELSSRVQQVVKAKFDVELVPEVFWLGNRN